MEYDVIISYSALESEIVDRLSAYLEYYNIKCFVAHRDIPADVAWANGISLAIRESRMAIVVYSDNYNSSEWLDRELESLSTSGSPIITLCLSSSPFSNGKSPYLKSTTCVDAVDSVDDSFVVVYEEICNMLGMPIENALHPAELLLQETVTELGDVAESQADTKKVSDEPLSKNKEPEKKQSHQLLGAFAVGIVLTVIVVLLLEFFLK